MTIRNTDGSVRLEDGECAISERFSKGGQLWFQWVFPSKSLRDLVFKYLTRYFPELNYCVEWYDAKGYGLMLGVVEWQKSGMYHCPPSKRYYSYDRQRWSQQDIREAAQRWGRGWRTMLVEFDEKFGPDGHSEKVHEPTPAQLRGIY